jgi:hypothetical protein
MELSPSWEAANYVATQVLPSILWNSKVHYRVHERPSLAPILTQINSIHTTPSYLSKIHLNLSSHLLLGVSTGLFPSGLQTNILYAFLFSKITATCPVHYILLNSIILNILGEEYKLWSSSLCSCLHPPVTSFLFGPNIPLNILLSNTLSLYPFLNVINQVSHPYRTTGKIIVLYNLIFMFLDSWREDKRFWTEW